MTHVTRRTPPRPVDVEALFPELRPLRREAVRLHPRAGRPSFRDSSVGGPLLWPADEPWPVCDAEHYERNSDTPYEGEVCLVPVVQVHRTDAPGLPFPPGCDLLQVLWCPYDHGSPRCPLPQVHWRSTGSVKEVRETPAPHAEASEYYVPDPCAVHPEQVVEYPGLDLPKDLFDMLGARLDRLERETGWHYQYHLAEAPGIKLGGYPGWTQEPVWPECGWCERRMDHLLTVSSWEYDGATWCTWLPVEDRESVGAGEPWSSERARAAQNPAGLMLGDAGGVYVFECRSCPERPVAHWFDCS
ncbi:DUF1963 domain-containing protein [Nocardiopsis sp. ARC36]